MPVLLKAMDARTEAQLTTSNPLGVATDRRGILSADTNAVAQPEFLLGGLLNALGPIGQLVNAIYGDYLDQLENMIILLAAKGILDAELTQTVGINGVLSSTALLGPYA